MLYLSLIISLTFGWFITNKSKNYSNNTNPLVSVIVAFKNEENNITDLINTVKQQSYSNFEVIFIDDHSIDNSLQIVKNNIQDNFKIIELSNIEFGKKRAISKGVENSTGELIVFTDADCYAGIDWLKGIVEFYNSNNFEFIISPVKYNNDNNFFKALFSLDFLSLQASGAGATNIFMPFICNSANLAFKKSNWEHISNLNEGKFVSGDDIFLLHNFVNKFGAKKVGYLFSQKAIVTTKPPNSINLFFKQRMRWASKAKGYKNIMSVFSSYTVFLFNLSILVLLIFSLFSHLFIEYFLLLFLLKIISDLPILVVSSIFFKQTKLLFYYIPMQLIYFIYIPVIAVLSLFLKIKWK